MIKKFLFAILSVTLLTACYEDKGDYDYRFDVMNEIDLDAITFTPAAYEALMGTLIEIQQPTEDEVKRIDVNLNQTLKEGVEHLDFTWRRENKNTGVIDSTYTRGYVELEFPGGASQEYLLYMTVFDRSTELSYYKKFSVKTRPLYKHSLFVLHGEVGSRKLGNVEVIGDRAEVRLDAYQYAHADATDNPFANTVAMTYASFYSRGLTRTIGFFNNDGTARVYEPYGFTEKFANISNYVLPSAATQIVPKQIVCVGNKDNMSDGMCLIDRQGRYYVAGRYICFLPHDIGVNSSLHQTDYTIATGTMMRNYYVLWDSKNNRFLYQQRNNNFGSDESQARQWETDMPRYGMYMNPLLDANVDFSALGSRTPVGKQAIYAYIASAGNEYESASPFFIFKDDATGTYYQYALSSLMGGKDEKKAKDGGKDDGKSESSNDPVFSIAVKELQGFEPGANSTIMYSPSFSTNYIFYANGGTVYRYNISNGDAYTVYDAPAGYNVSVMKFRSPYAATYTGFLGRYLSIGLEKGGTGAVVEVKLTNAGDVDESYESVLYEGFGRIADLQYVFDYTDTEY